METLTGIAWVGGGLMVYFLFQILIAITDLLKELKGLRFQLQEIFAPEDLNKGHYGHPRATHQLVEKILRELQQGRPQ